MWQHKTWDVGHQETAVPRRWVKHAQPAIQSQHRSTEDDLKILFRILFYLTLFKITSLLCNHDFVLYAWTQIDTIWICTAEERWILWRLYVHFRWGKFNPYLPSGSSLLTLLRNLLPWTLILIYQDTTIWRVFQPGFISRRGVVYEQDGNINGWRRVFEVAEVLWNRTLALSLEEGHEVES